MPDRMGKKEEGVLRRQPVITRIDSFKGTSMSFVCALRHHTGAQYSAGADVSAKPEVLRALKEAPQPTPASRLMSATRDEAFFFWVCVSVSWTTKGDPSICRDTMDVSQTSLLHWVLIWHSADSWLSGSSGGRRSTQFSQLRAWVSA